MRNSVIFVVFHGSYCIVDNPKIIESHRTKDFGPAFYCTRDLGQAKRFSLRRARQRNKDKGVVSTFTCSSYKGLKVKEFHSTSNEWLDFVISCRKGKKHDYDIVIGPVADDGVHQSIDLYLQGVITKSILKRNLSRNAEKSDQVAFCTEDSLKILHYEGVLYYAKLSK